MEIMRPEKIDSTSLALKNIGSTSEEFDDGEWQKMSGDAAPANGKAALGAPKPEIKRLKRPLDLLQAGPLSRGPLLGLRPFSEIVSTRKSKQET